MRARPIRSRIFLPVVKLGLVSDDWQWVAVISFAGFFLPYLFWKFVAPATFLRVPIFLWLGFDGNTIRHRDGSYSRLYELVLQETMLATDAATDMFCDDLARLLCLPLPKGAILRFRYAVYPDPGEAIARHLDVRHNVGIERIHLPSAQLHDGRIDFYRQVTAAGGFRRERALLEVRIPSSLKSDAPASFSENFFPELAREV